MSTRAHEGFMKFKTERMRIVELEKSVAAIEARQRSYDQHDPNCPLFQVFVAQKSTDAYILPRPCTCWLSKANPSEEKK